MGSISLFILPVNSTLTDVVWSWIYSQTNPRKQKSCRLWVGNCLHLFHNHPDARRHTHGEEEDEEEEGQETGRDRQGGGLSPEPAAQLCTASLLTHTNPTFTRVGGKAF